MKLIYSICPLTIVLAMGCAATGPSPELMDARRAYDSARQSPAATYSPNKLLSAKQALERAEAAHSDDSGSFEEKSLAYVAQRKAQYATVYGGYEQARQEEATAAQAYRQRQDQLRHNAEAQTTAVERSLAATWNNLSEARKEIAAKEGQIQKSKADLENEKQARERAEKSTAAAMASLSKIAQVKEEQRGVVITLDGSVLFVTGKAELLPIAKDKLNTVALALKDMDDDKLASIEGFTDSRGADDMNLKLSQDRAEAVKNYLASQGVKAEKLRALGKGEASPVASNETPEGRANNRRVEIVIQTSAQAVEGMRR